MTPLVATALLPVWAIVVIAVVMLLLVIGMALVSWYQGVPPQVQHDRLNIYRERDNAIADIVRTRREAERQMRRIVRDDPNIIEGTLVEEDE